MAPITLAPPGSKVPQHAQHLIVSFPIPHVLLLTFNRPKALNAMNTPLRLDVERVMDWFDNEKELWVAIVTGNGRAFCAGADLKSYVPPNTVLTTTNAHPASLA